MNVLILSPYLIQYKTINIGGEDGREKEGCQDKKEGIRLRLLLLRVNGAGLLGLRKLPLNVPF